ALALHRGLPARRGDRLLRRLLSHHRRDPRLDHHAAGRTPGGAAAPRRAARRRPVSEAVAGAPARRGSPVTRPPGPALPVAIPVIWGLNWSAVKLAVDELPALTFSALRLVFAGIGMLAICRLGRLPLGIPRREVGPLLIMALFNVTLWHVCAAFGVSFLASGRAAILAFTMPLWAALLAVPMLGERLGWNVLAGLVIGLAAVGVLVAPGWRGGPRLPPRHVAGAGRPPPLA